MKNIKKSKWVFFMKILKRGIIVFSALILLCALVFVVLLTFLTVYSRKNINYTADEALFQAAKLGNVSKFYANAAPLGTDDYVPVEIESVSHTENQKIWYTFDTISDYLKKGFVAVEDREFYEHKGVNIRRTMAALLNSIFKFDKRFGASTITQQVVKNISGDDDISFKRKLNEILRAYKIEKNHTKEEILELYMNIVPLGEKTLGVGAASLIYFGKEPDELKINEAAMLVGITNAPTRLNPYNNPEECISRRNFVISSMRDCGFISEEEYLQAINSELEVLPRGEPSESVNSWFIETVISDITRDISNKYSISKEVAAKYVRGAGLTVYTTENINIQNELEMFFENRQNLPDEVEEGLQYSCVVVDSKNGNLLGIIGQAGKKEGNLLLNHAQVPHTPASTLKPIALYAPLIDSGIINWATVFDDSPISIKEKEGEISGYPKNSPNRYDGLITVENALKLSKNTVAVRLYDLLGGNTIYDNLINSFGFDSLSKKDIAPSPLALGQLTYGIPIRKLVEAYTVFPSYGVLNKQRSYIAVFDNKNELILNNSPEEKRVFKHSTAQIMNMLLSGVTSEGTAHQITLKNSYDTAGKTGTSSMNRDKLFVGYTPYMTIGLWCGYDNSNGSVNGTTPSNLEIWDKIAAEIHDEVLRNVPEEHIEHFDTAGLLYLPYCLDSGKLLSDSCFFDSRGDRIGFGYFTEENKPNDECDRHILKDGNFSLLYIPERKEIEGLEIIDEEYRLKY